MGKAAEQFSIRDIGERDEWCCYLCGEEVDRSLVGLPPRRRDLPTMDHLVPMSRGGAHVKANVALAHLGCNARKRDRLLSEMV